MGEIRRWWPPSAPRATCRPAARYSDCAVALVTRGRSGLVGDFRGELGQDDMQEAQGRGRRARSSLKVQSTSCRAFRRHDHVAGAKVAAIYNARRRSGRRSMQRDQPSVAMCFGTLPSSCRNSLSLLGMEATSPAARGRPVSRTMEERRRSPPQVRTFRAGPRGDATGRSVEALQRGRQPPSKLTCHHLRQRDAPALRAWPVDHADFLPHRPFLETSSVTASPPYRAPRRRILAVTGAACA